ncbi:MAG: hypothetical protein LBJ63_06205 [Prevotellaceae bacterium]|jgi:hypothetical protein|nr:hypothetical protein [Prevotellaceae bacterium]
MKKRILNLCFMATVILFAASCQKDYSEDKNITSARSDETLINAQGQNLERIILPMEESGNGLPAYYISEIKDGKEILTPMQQLPPSVPGGGSCGAMLGVITPDVYNGYLYFTVGDVIERSAPTLVDPIYSSSSTGLGIWDYIHLSYSDFGYLITNNGNKIKLTAKKTTTNESNKIACGIYEVFICTPGYSHPPSFPSAGENGDGTTIYMY